MVRARSALTINPEEPMHDHWRMGWMRDGSDNRDSQDGYSTR